MTKPFVATYLRVSTDEQERSGVGLGVQRARCRQYARAAGWPDGREYLDVMSGHRDGRPEYQAMLTEVRKRRANGEEVVVLVDSLDRLGRRLLEAVRCRAELKTLHVDLHSVREGGVVPDLVANILGAVAEDELLRRRERLWAATRHVVANGWFLPGVRPWGYRLRPATPGERREGAPRVVPDVDPDTAPCVREVFARSARGESSHSLSRWLRTQPATATGGLRLSASVLCKLLRSPTYVGRRPGDPLGRVDPPARWPAIVDLATWEQVQYRFDTPIRWRSSGNFLLSSFLLCPRCGAQASKGSAHRSTVPRWPVYRCNRRGKCEAYIGPLATLDADVLRQVRKVVSTFLRAQLTASDALEAAWASAQRPSAAQERERMRAEAKGATARRRLARAGELLSIGDLDLIGYELVRDAAQRDLDAARATLDASAAALPSRRLAPLPEVLKLVPVWSNALDGSDVRAQRQVLGHLVARVAATRVRRGVYDVNVTWTPLGRALREIPRRARRLRTLDQG